MSMLRQRLMLLFAVIVSQMLGETSTMFAEQSYCNRGWNAELDPRALSQA